MRKTLWTDAHDRLLVEAKQTVSEASDAQIERVWLRVASTMDGQSGHRNRRHTRLRVGIGAGIGAIVLGTSGLAAAALYTAHTGQGPNDAEDLRLGGPGERLAVGATDYGKVVAEETTDIPFPTVKARGIAVQDQVDDARGAGSNEFVSTGAVRAWVADAAVCAWSNQWAAATRSSDEDDRAAAIEMIQAAPTWPAVVAIDPDPYSRVETQKVDDGTGTITREHYRDESQFFYLKALGKVVEGRDPGAVARVLAENNGYCSPALVPDLPNANPMHAAH